MTAKRKFQAKDAGGNSVDVTIAADGDAGLIIRNPWVGDDDPDGSDQVCNIRLSKDDAAKMAEFILSAR